MVSHSVLLLCSSLVCLVAGKQAADIHTGVGDFSLRLLGSTVKGDENTVHSGYSIVTALGICLLGAREATWNSMKNTMGLAHLKDEDIREAFKTSTQQILQENAFTLETANRLYVNESYPLGTSFQKEVNEIFHADAHNVNFKKNGQEVQQSINSFVSNRTRSLIPQILGSPLPPETVMAVVNALYFKGAWPEEMKKAPLEKHFNAHTCDSAQSIVTHQKAKWLWTQRRFLYADSATLQASLIELPYVSNRNSDQEASLIIVLPAEEHKCDVSAWVKQHLTWSAVAEAVKSMELTNVEVTLPQFEVEAEFELAKILVDMGMEPAFLDSANFNGMVDEGAADLKISEVFHKAKVTVDEHGTEAAASTAVIMEFTRSGRVNLRPAKQIAVDRSFIAMVILRQSDQSIVPLFTSVVNKV